MTHAPFGRASANANVVDDEKEFSPLSNKQPTAEELQQTQALKVYLESCRLYEDQAMLQRREEALGRLLALANEWVKSVSRSLLFDDAMVEDQRALIFTFGSYRLGVHNPGGDIDVLCVGPKHCSRDGHFFGEGDVIFETMLRAHPDVSEVHPVPGAFVPVMKIRLHGIDMDILYASLPMGQLPPDLDLRQDSVLRGLDERTANTINGSRVTDTVLSLVPNPEAFHVALKFVKKWAENRGIYANKLGLLGGINFAILVAKTCQWFPTASAAKVVRMFFHILSEWKWPRPVLLTRIDYANSMGHKVWAPTNPNPFMDVMPIITPVYPAFNSTHNVSLATKEVLVQEFKRGREICDRIFASPEPDFASLAELFDFFAAHKKFLAIEIAGRELEHFKAWQGWVMARLRRLVSDIQTYVCVRPYQSSVSPPKAHQDPSMHRCYLFLGLSKRKGPLLESMQPPPKQINLTFPAEQWAAKIYEDSRDYQANRIRDVTVTVSLWGQGDLPAWIGQGSDEHGASGEDGAETRVPALSESRLPEEEAGEGQEAREASKEGAGDGPREAGGAKKRVRDAEEDPEPSAKRGAPAGAEKADNGATGPTPQAAPASGALEPSKDS